MKLFASAALLSGIISLGAVTSVSAQSAQAVEHSGHVFHIKACPAFEGPRSARCFAHIVTDASGNPITSAASRNITPSGFGPAQLRDAYMISPAPCPTINGAVTCGSGATVAIVDAYGYPTAASDLAVYRAQFGLGTANLTVMNEHGSTSGLPKTNSGWDQEQALDLDMVSAMCPNCKILLVQASSASDADLTTAVNTAAAMGARVISNSYGGGENGSGPFEPAYNHPGVAITASAGDSGYGAQFPATSPHVIAVGGTSLTKSNNARGWSEAVWSGTGSGCSAVFGKPTWQKDTMCGTRMEADVSAVADPNTGVAVYGPANRRGSAWMVFGGTSVAAPLIGGIYGEKNDTATCATDPKFTVGCASTIYAHASSLNDITSGSNGSCGGTYFCTAGGGYDGPTGLGTPNRDTAF